MLGAVWMDGEFCGLMGLKAGDTRFPETETMEVEWLIVQRYFVIAYYSL